MKVLWLDTETTGLDYRKHGIVQLAMIAESDEVVQDKLVLTMKPTGRVADDVSLELNKYTREQIASFEPWEKVYRKVKKFLHKYIDRFDREDKFILGGQNVGFDSDFMKSWFEHCDDPYWFSLVEAGAFIDTYKILTFLQWIGKIPILENRKNQTLCKHFGIDLSNAHDALADIEATRAVAYKMRDLL